VICTVPWIEAVESEPKTPKLKVLYDGHPQQTSNGVKVRARMQLELNGADYSRNSVINDGNDEKSQS